MLSPEGYYLSVAEADNAHPWAAISGEALLKRELRDKSARHYVRTMAHSDVAAAAAQDQWIEFLKERIDGRGRLYGYFFVVGGNDQIVQGLLKEIGSEIRLNSNVQSGDAAFRWRIPS